jgi:hypothetical protein
MTHQHTAHGHEEVQVKALPRQGEARQQQQQIINRAQQQQQQGQQQSCEPVQSNPMDMHILHQPDGFVPLSSTTAGPAAVAAAASAAAHDRHQQGQQQAHADAHAGLAAAGGAGGEGGAVGAWLHSWASSSTKGGTLIMPHQQQHQQYHHQQLVQQMGGAGVQQQQRGPHLVRGWVPRCEWELDPRKVLVGRRLAVGGFAEVFLGKYEVRVVERVALQRSHRILLSM